MKKFNPKNCYAFIIGVGKRPDDEELMSVTTNDAKKLSESLVDFCEYPIDNITLLTKKEETSHDGILNHLDTFIHNVNSNPNADLAIIYFSGHGTKHNNEFYLICHDSVNHNWDDKIIKGKTFTKKLKQIHSQKLLVLLDTCHAGAFVDSTPIPLETASLINSENRAIIASSYHTEKSIITNPLSLYTIALIEGLTGKCLKDDQENVTLFELAMYVRETVQYYSNYKQEPILDVFKGTSTTPFVISSFSRKKPLEEYFGKAELNRIEDNQGNRILKNLKGIKERDESYREKLKLLFDDIKYEVQPLTHFKTRVEILNNLPEDDKFLFDNNLLFFTEREKQDYQKIIDYYLEPKINQATLLLGHPATGKSIGVLEIARKLESLGKTVYYRSFKTQGTDWGEILKECLRYKSLDTIFVLDDIHLNHSNALEAYSKFTEHNNLNLLFISRVLKNRNTIDGDIYESLEEYTIETEKPSIDKKVEGIIKNFKSYYQSKSPTSNYQIGNINLIVKKVHRNLIVLREYLRIWDGEFGVPLSNIREKQLYKNLYNRYFDGHNKPPANWQDYLLQYLTLYYFETSFHANPKYRKETEELAINTNRIVSEQKDLYSIYHGEYAHLLLKSYRSNNEPTFQRYYKTWENFIFEQIKNYLLSFRNKEIPNNLITILNNIARFSKELGIVQDAGLIFKRLLEDETIGEFIIESCEFVDDGKWDKQNNQNGRIKDFMSSLGFYSPQLFRSFFEVFAKEDKLFRLIDSFSIYSLGLFYFQKNKLESELNWLLNYDDEKIILLANNSALHIISVGLRKLSFRFFKKARTVYRGIEEEELVKKVEASSFIDIGNALINLLRIDGSKTKALYVGIKKEKLIEKAEAVSLGGIGYALSKLLQVNEAKTRGIYGGIRKDKLVEKAEVESFHKIGNTLINLLQIDGSKTKALYVGIKKEKLLEKAEAVSFNRIGYALNNLLQVNESKTKEIYQDIREDKLLEKVEAVSFDRIGHALNNLLQVNESKTKEIYQDIRENKLVEKAEAESFHKIGNALNELLQVDEAKTKALYEGIKEEKLIEKAEAVSFDRIGKALNELLQVGEAKTKALYEGIKEEKLIGKAEAVSLDRIGNALSNLLQVDGTKTKEIYKGIRKDKLVEKAEAVSFDKIGYALNNLLQVDRSKTRALYNAVGNDVIFKKINNRKIVYKTLLICLKSFPKLDAFLAKKLLKKIPEDTLLNWRALKRIDLLNILLSILIEAKFEKSELKYKRLLEYSFLHREDYFRSNNLRDLGNYIINMLNASTEWKSIIDANLGRFKGKILYTEDKGNIADFISNIHRVHPEGAINYLLKSYVKANPTENEVIGYSHLFIAKTLIEEKEKRQGKFHLQQAKNQFTKIDREEALAEIEVLFKTLDDI